VGVLVKIKLPILLENLLREEGRKELGDEPFE
jgi:hypothetical protein